jgi:RNA polymerase sigma-70 factor (ECF subfamily)
LNEHDRDLVGRMLAGDERAFDEFFDGYFPVLYRFAMVRMDRDADGAEEVVQATLCRAVGKLGTWRGEATLLTWLCTFCRHEIAAYFARAGRRPPGVALSEEVPEVAAALESLSSLAGTGPEDVLRRKEIERLVHVTLDRLPARYADALEWKYIEGLPVREIAGRLALSEKAAESLLTRAREAFRDGFATLTSDPTTWRVARTDPS